MNGSAGRCAPPADTRARERRTWPSAWPWPKGSSWTQAIALPKGKAGAGEHRNGRGVMGWPWAQGIALCPWPSPWARNIEADRGRERRQVHAEDPEATNLSDPPLQHLLPNQGMRTAPPLTPSQRPDGGRTPPADGGKPALSRSPNPGRRGAGQTASPAVELQSLTNSDTKKHHKGAPLDMKTIQPKVIASQGISRIGRG